VFVLSGLTHTTLRVLRTRWLTASRAVSALLTRWTRPGWRRRTGRLHRCGTELTVLLAPLLALYTHNPTRALCIAPYIPLSLSPPLVACPQTLERLDTEFQQNKALSQLPKEAIRVGYHDMGDFLFARGDLNGAFKAYVRSRDYCTTTSHVLDLCFAVIRTTLEMPTATTHVPNFVQKAESALESTGTAATAAGDREQGGSATGPAATALSADAQAVVTAKLRVAAALALLAQKKYKTVARRLGDVPPDLGGADFGDMHASPSDVATYGALCALASLDRPGLRSTVIDNVAFRTYLDACPDMRDLVLDFYGGRYGSALGALDRLSPSWRLDPHLAEHVVALCDDIRSKALAAYVAPFSRVRIADIANALHLDVPQATKQLEKLIQDDAVAARIDTAAGVVHARWEDARAQAFTATLAAGSAYIRDTKALLVRASMMQNDVSLTGKRGGGQGGDWGNFDTASPVKAHDERGGGFASAWAGLGGRERHGRPGGGGRRGEMQERGMDRDF
jgi:COP9 signalosome complex subunit 1